MKQRYSEEQIVIAIKQQETGAKVNGIFYNWRKSTRAFESS